MIMAKWAKICMIFLLLAAIPSNYCFANVRISASLSANPTEIIQPTTYECSSIALPLNVEFSGGGGPPGALECYPDSPVVGIGVEAADGAAGAIAVDVKLVILRPFVLTPEPVTCSGVIEVE